MAGEALSFGHKERRSIRQRAKEVVLWAAEKNIYLTAPLTGYLLLTGAISIPVAILALGTDVVTSKAAADARKR